MLEQINVQLHVKGTSAIWLCTRRSRTHTGTRKKIFPYFSLLSTGYFKFRRLVSFLSQICMCDLEAIKKYLKKFETIFLYFTPLSNWPSSIHQLTHSPTGHRRSSLQLFFNWLCTWRSRIHTGSRKILSLLFTSLDVYFAFRRLVSFLSQIDNLIRFV